jgi:branched-subunit amino acid ABC-type transport system permease component
MFMRGINFSCSLIVLSMLSTTFTIFNATKALPPRNNLPPWAVGTSTWPQITLLVIACISMAISVFVIATNWRRGHHRAEKIGIYYTTFSVAIFIFSIVMWIVGAVVLNQSKANGNGNDLWGWSCKNNTRSNLFQQDVSYSIICRLQVCDNHIP